MTELLALFVMMARDADLDRSQRPRFVKMWRDGKRQILGLVATIDTFVDGWMGDASAAPSSGSNSKVN